MSTPENAGPRGALQQDSAIFNPQQRALAQANDGSVVFFEELVDSFFLCFTHVSGSRIRIAIVRTNLEINKPQRIERGRLHDWHVLGGFESRKRHDRTITGTVLTKPDYAACVDLSPN